MKFLTAQPDNDYSIWQLQVQMNNFKKFGIEDSSIILFGYNSKTGINPNALKLRDNTTSTVIFIPDDRIQSDKKYIPTIRPYLLKKFFEKYSDLVKNESWMYHDSDIIFREIPDIDKFEEQSNIWVSDTRSYLDSKYIKSKHPELFNKMCEIVKISPQTVEANDSTCGGAQYIFNKAMPLDAAFWDKVLSDSSALFKFMQKTSKVYSPDHPIQSWTADMWAVLWNLWLRKYPTQINEQLSFSWATSNIAQWEKCKIFHNAGVTEKDKHLFFKGKYIHKAPFGDDFSYVNKNTCSYKYVEEILDTKKSLNHFS